MPDPNDIQRDLKLLEAELKKLEAEYTMFFAGRLPRPPWETRARVESIIKRWERGQIQTSIDRFRFNTLQTRFVTFADLWDRGLRAKEEGRPGPFGLPQPPPAPAKAEQEKENEQGEKPEKAEKAEPKTVFVASFNDPAREMDKLHSLYDSLMNARRQAGDDIVPFHKFTALVKEQVKRLRDDGSEEVAFRVTVKEGKVSFTARGVKGKKQP